MKVFILLAVLTVAAWSSVECQDQHTVIYTTLNVGNPNPKTRLRGLALISPPFVAAKSNYQSGNLFEGYFVDVLDAAIASTPYDYSLAVSTAYPNHRAAIDAVKDKTYDFAVGDLTVNEDRKKNVDFTISVLNVSLSALVGKSHFTQAKNLKELVEQTHQLADVRYGIVKNGSTHDYLSKSQDPLAVKIYNKISSATDESLFDRIPGDVEKVKTGKLIFITESSITSYHASKDCSLRTVNDDGSLSGYNGQQAFAFSKGSPAVAELNKAIKKLADDGTLDTLQNKYWVPATC